MKTELGAIMAQANLARPSKIIADRLSRCRRQMKKHRISAYLISSPTDSFYLAGFSGEDSAVLLTPKEVHLITDRRFEESSRKECPWAKAWMRKGMLNDEIANVSKALKIKSLAIQSQYMSVASHAALKKLIRSTRLTNAPTILSDMRQVKSSAELVTMRKAIRVAEDAFVAMRKSIRVGQTELALAARLEYEMKLRGASGASFPTICAEGPNAALPHASPGSRRVKRGSAVLFDWGAKIGGYCSDLTRMVFIGSMPRKLEVVYSIVLEAQQRAIAAIRPGRRMCDIDAVARDHITGAGYGEAFGHGLGHGLGLNVHEAPSLSWRSKEKLVAGMVVTVEPGVYLPGIGGIRIEDDVLVTPNGRSVMSRLGKNPEDAIIRIGR
jgi:Xaa-Pro aminopeptidase